ncbi:EndoU domain-containing protein [Lentzea alba]|uniref:polymorphic toxin-type HINT domain-containing protein n=1 Tax=Lentzea alba TaxID=2714351 RepID=UPI0039BF20E8
MKRGPFFAAPVMMAPGESYADAVRNWATYVCRSSNPGPGFCEWSETVGNSPADGWDAVFVALGAASLAFGAGAGARGAGAGLRGAAGSSRQAVGNGIRAAARSCNSFLGDTQVLMADGSTKRIDELKVGDQVFATDPGSGESGAREVLATLVNEGVKVLVEIEIDGDKITATAGHPFWLVDHMRWVDAKDLRVGSNLQTSTGKIVKVVAVKKRVALKRVHNLTVDKVHTYHVLAGSTSILVHNSSCGVGRQLLGEKASTHIIDNHAYPGLPGKDVFPSAWTHDEILDAVAEVVTSPNSTRVWKTGSAYHAERTLKTRKGDPTVQAIVGEVRGVTIEVRYQPLNDEVLTAFPR